MPVYIITPVQILNGVYILCCCFAGVVHQARIVLGKRRSARLCWSLVQKAVHVAVSICAVGKCQSHTFNCFLLLLIGVVDDIQSGFVAEGRRGSGCDVENSLGWCVCPHAPCHTIVSATSRSSQVCKHHNIMLSSKGVREKDWRSRKRRERLARAGR
jgi:hypothetical protein